MFDAIPIRILLLSDGRLKDSDGPDDSDENRFGLTRLKRVLEDEKGGPFLFKVTRSHIEDYSQVDLTTILGTNLYDEAWFFGDCYPMDSTMDHRKEEQQASRKLDPTTELAYLTKFMQTAGVFATGDHNDLGGALNGQTVRVRYMRRWLSRQNPPPRNGDQRHDTLTNPSGIGSRLPYKAIWQEDFTPQVINPEPFGADHPLLFLSPDGIKVLPDHMHEGECYAPPDNYNDFPISGGSRPLPIVVAKSQFVESHATDDYAGFPSEPSKNDTTPRGLIGAYDGHTAGVGNVVVDSSFHHFLNLNLNGFAASTEPEGIEAYRQIKAYFRNIASFLAPATHRLTASRRILFAVASNLNLSSSTGYQLDALVSIGKEARAMASRMVSPSFVLQWALELANDSGVPEVSRPLVNPWLPRVAGSKVYTRETETVVSAIIGSAVVSIVESARTRQAGEPAYSDAWLRTAVQSGLAQLAPSLAQLPGSVPEARSGKPEGVNRKGETSMPGIWYRGDWLLSKSDNNIWTIHIGIVGTQPYAQVAPCSNPPTGCNYTSPTRVIGPNDVATGDVSISFCTNVMDPGTTTESTYCFMIRFYYRVPEQAQTLSFRYLKHGSAAVGLSAATSLDDDGSGTGTRPGTLLAPNPSALKPPVITGDAKDDDGSGTGTQPGSTIEL